MNYIIKELHIVSPVRATLMPFIHELIDSLRMSVFMLHGIQPKCSREIIAGHSSHPMRNRYPRQSRLGPPSFIAAFASETAIALKPSPRSPLPLSPPPLPH